MFKAISTCSSDWFWTHELPAHPPQCWDCRCSLTCWVKYEDLGMCTLKRSALTEELSRVNQIWTLIERIFPKTVYIIDYLKDYIVEINHNTNFHYCTLHFICTGKAFGNIQERGSSDIPQRMPQSLRNSTALWGQWDS